jgi:hypothetical protein
MVKIVSCKQNIFADKNYSAYQKGENTEETKHTEK